MNVFRGEELERAGERNLLAGCALGAFALEAVVLTVVGWNGHWLAHPAASNPDSGFVEAQVFEMPRTAHLVAPPSAQVPKPEATLSKVAGQGRKSNPDERAAQADEQNQTAASGDVTPPTHGPLALYSPSPKIPSYLQDQNLHVSVVLDFLVSALGHVTVRMVRSSGNDELDGLALSTAAKWQFRPAEKDHHPVDAKVRLRINFDVQ